MFKLLKCVCHGVGAGQTKMRLSRNSMIFKFFVTSLFYLLYTWLRVTAAAVILYSFCFSRLIVTRAFITILHIKRNTYCKCVVKQIIGVIENQNRNNMVNKISHFEAWISLRKEKN